MTDEFKDTEFKAKVYSCSKCDYLSLLPKPVDNHIASKCVGATVVISSKIVQHFTKGYVEGKIATIHQCSHCSHTTPYTTALKHHQRKCEGDKAISAKRVLIFKDDTDLKIPRPKDTDLNTKPVVYMRVHRDTGYYYIGSTQVSVMKRHSVDVDNAIAGKKLGSNITALIWGILLREGDPYEEFDFITLGEYETRQEALDTELNMIDMYYNDKGDRDNKMLLNKFTYQTRFRPQVVPMFSKKGGLRGYEVKGGPNKVYMSFRNNRYSIDDLRKFAEEYANTEVIPTNYEQTKCGVKRDRT